jgi:hypothetical protein
MQESQMMRSPLALRLFVTDVLVLMCAVLLAMGILIVESRRWGLDLDTTPLLWVGGLLVLVGAALLLGVRHQRSRFGDGPSWWVMVGYTISTLLIPIFAGVGLGYATGWTTWGAALGSPALWLLSRATTFPLLQRYAGG